MNIKELETAWQESCSKSITFIVTKDCQLACKYCYLVGKNSKERMTWEVAKAAIDYILDHEQDMGQESVVWDFIGGEPFLEIDLVDKICDYLKVEMYRRNHHWFNSYRFSFSTNGINYGTEKVQRFIKKNRDHLSIGITIDGTKRKHDLNRIWKTKEMEAGVVPKPEDEQGSYEDVVKNIPLWLEQFPGASTKVTISSADIPYIKESVLHLYSLGIHEVNINCVFERVWKEGDDVLFENQLVQLADAIIDGGYYQDYACSFFVEHIGKPMDCQYQNQNWCGAGMMLAVDAEGNFYPCTRFAQYSLRNKKAWIIGNVRDGIDKNKLRPFLTLDRCTQSSQECIDCEVADGCAWCQGENYDAADTPTVYQRATAICKMHKARVRANNIHELCFLTQGEENNHRKEELYRLTFDEDNRVAFNALHVLSNFDLANNEWLYCKHDELIDRVMKEEHVGKRRLMLNLLLRQPFEEEFLRSDFIDFCVSKITACAQPYAIRAYCMKLAYGQMKYYPELLSELKMALDMLEQETLSPGLASAKRQILMKIKRKHSLS